MSLSTADKAIRATGIGASEAWKVVTRENIHEVFLRLCFPHLLVQDESPVVARKGNALEPLIAELYAERFDIPLDRIERVVGTLRHPEHPFVLATPDGIVNGEERSLVEIKAPTWHTRDDWGPDGSEVYPLRYRIQCTIQMAVTGIHRTHLVALPEGADAITVHPVPWDPELAALAIDSLHAFWHQHVLPKEPPETDGSAAAAGYLAKRYPKNRGEMRAPSVDPVLMIDGTELAGDVDLARELRRVKAEIKALKAREDLLANVAKARTEDADGVEGCWTWKLPKTGRGRVEWKSVVEALQPPAALIERFTSPPGRTLRLVGEEE